MSIKNTGKAKRWGCLSCSLALIVGLLAAVGLFILAGSILITADPLEKAEAVVLLSGGDEARMQEAIRIYDEKFADTIILTETGEDVPGYNVQYSKEQRDLLVEKGVPLGAIRITEKPVGSTRGEAKAVRNLLENDHDVHTIIVVTDSYHTFRTRLQFNDVFRGSNIKVLIRPVRGSWYRSETWFLSPRGWEATVLEYAKLAGYLFEKRLD
jgi:uncharacterized SAM-binding protein YcdF (DUF218 family)